MKKKLLLKSYFTLINKQFLFLFMLLLAANAWGQTTSVWNQTSANGAWLTAGNWTPSGVPTSTIIAQYSNAATGSGINTNTTSANNAAAIDFKGTAAFTLGNSAGSATGTLTLAGVTVNSIANTIVRNSVASNLTLAGHLSGSSNVLTYVLGNSTDNVVNIESTGNITISGPISGTSRKLSKVGSGTGILILSGANTYSGGTTITAGTLQLGAAQTLPVGNPGGGIILNGGTLKSGATTGFSNGTSSTNNMGTLTLSSNSTLALGTGVHNLYFAASNAVTWAGSLLTITGWTGTAGASGTAGKIFIGASASGLTSSQLAKITFSGYTAGAALLSTGELVPVSTVIPTVTTTAVSAIAETSASSGGNVTADGGAAVTARGVYFGTSANPASGTSNGTGTGTFTSSLSSLSVNTRYYYRAYATNSVGTGYGSESSFYTLANMPSAPTVNTPTVNSLNVAITSGDGNPSITAYAIYETTTSKYVQADGTLGASAVWQTASAWGTKTVTGLTANTTYTFEVKARNGDSTETTFSSTASGTTDANQEVDWANLQFISTPTTYDEGTTTNTVYAQVYKASVTNSAGQCANIQSWIFYSTSNTNPNSDSGWTWVLATYNTDVGNNDEYKATLPALTPGTYYIASRFNYNGGTYKYGGTGGLWNNDSGTITVNHNLVGFGNFQSPTSGTLVLGNTYNVYGQVYKAGTTEAAGQGSGITAEVGYSASDTNPNTWTNWYTANYNLDAGNNDEYFYNMATPLTTSGTYYMAFRYKVTGSTEYYYGGTSGVWSNNNAVVTVKTPREINVKQNTTNIASAGSYAFSSQVSGTSSSAISFTVENTGQDDLTLGALSISGTNADQFSITQAVSSTVTGGSSTTFTVTFSPTSAGAKTAQLSLINNDSDENPYVINISGTATSNALSDITVKSGYTYPTNILYANYQGTNITGGSNDLEIAQFTIRDGGSAGNDTDNLATTLSQLTVNVSNSSNIRRIALYDGTTEIAEAAGSASVIFTGLSLQAADNGTKDFSIRVSFNAAVTDNQSIGLTIAATTSAATSGSTFAATTAGAAATSTTGDNNKIEVVADRLAFVQQPTNTNINTNMSPAVTVSANDVNANRDLDFVSAIAITSTGTLSSTPVSATAVAGLATYSTLQHTAAGTGFKLSAASSGLTGTDSNTFNITLVTLASDYFRSNVATGSWATAGSWQSSPDNTNWITSTLAPTSAANTITIRNGNNITVDTSITIDQLLITNGQLTVDSTLGTLNINDGTGVDVDIQSGGVLQVLNSGSTFAYSSTIIFSGSASMNVSGKIQVGDGTSSAVGSGYGGFGFASASQIIWNNGAILEWNNTGSTPGISGQTYFPGVSSSVVPIFRITKIAGGSLSGGSPTIINGLFQLNGANVIWAGNGSRTFRNGIVSTGTSSMTISGGTGKWQIGDDTVAGNAEIGGSGGALTLSNTNGVSVSSVCSSSVTSNFTLSSGTLTNNGTINFGTYAVTGAGGFTEAAGSTIITSNTGGVPASVAVSGTKNFSANGANYTFNANTTAPFPTVTMGNPASLTFNNANVTSNKTGNIIVAGAVNINGTSVFALNSGGNNLDLGGIMTVDANATFDNNGENQITNGGGSIVINGTFITRDAQGFTGTGTSIPGITPTLGNNATVVYGLNGNQQVTDFAYKNLTFSGSGTKTSGTVNSITGTVTIDSGVTLDADSRTFGGSGTNLTMLGTSIFKTGGSSTKPDASGTYTLANTSTIEFGGTSATVIRAAPIYGNINITGTSAGISLSGDATSLTLQNGSSFTVKSGGMFNVRNTNGFSGAYNTAISNVNTPSIVLETGSIVNYNGNDQTITTALSYENLNVSSVGTKSPAGNLTVNNLTTISAGTLKLSKTADNVNANVFYAHKGINNTGGSVIFENNAQLLQDADAVNSGNIQSQRDVVNMNNISTQMDYVYWSSPVSGQPIKGTTGFSPNTPASGYLQYTESTDKFVVTSDVNFATGKGYAIRAETGTNGYNKTYNFTGIPHNANLQFQNLKWTNATHGYNLVGNPYPSNIDFDLLFTLNNTKIYSTAFFWTNNSYTAAQTGSNYSGNNYAVYNGTGGSPATYNPSNPYNGSMVPNGKIKVGQAFIVQAKQTGKDAPLDFNNNIRVTDQGTFFQKNANPKNRFWLEMTSPNSLVNTILVGYITGATNNYETDFDAELFVVGSDSFYSVLGTKKLAIQGKSDQFNIEDVIPLGNAYSATGNYTIKLKNPEGIFNSNQKVYLHDKLLNKYVDLSNSNSYSFTGTKGTDNTRFEIVYKESVVLGTDSVSKADFIVYRDGNDFVINSSKVLGKIEVYDASGRMLITSSTKEKSIKIDASTLINGIYIIKAENSGDIKNKKIMK